MSLILQTPIEEYFRKYRESRNDYWLTLAAYSMLSAERPMPDLLASHVGQILRKELKGLSPKRKAKTQDKWDRYCWRIFTLQKLTGVSPEKAAERILLVDEENHESDVPEHSTLMKEWFLRAKRFHRPLNLEDLDFLEILSKEEADHYNETAREFSVIPPKLNIKKSIIDSLPDYEYIPDEHKPY